MWAHGRGQFLGVVCHLSVLDLGCVFIYLTNTYLACTLYLLGVGLGCRAIVLGPPLDLWKPQAKHQGDVDGDRLHLKGLEQRFSGHGS